MTQRRAQIDSMASIPAKHRRWLESNNFEWFCYYGWGIIPNDAQVESVLDIINLPPGTINVWRWANRTGKTTGLVLAHTFLAWLKWRYLNESLDDWIGFRYKTLHAAPSNRLAGKAWELIDAWTNGSGDQQMNRRTHRRINPEALFVKSGLFIPRSGKEETNTEALWCDLANGSRIDFLSTHDGAGRMESDAWWFIDWDEFTRHQPIDAVPNLIDQTFIPRSADYMATIVLSGTATLQSDAVYAEIEEMASSSPKWWNFKSFARAANFTQTQESIDRQMDVAFDKATAQRSVMGGVGEGGSGALFPGFVVSNAFTRSILEERRAVDDLPPLPLDRAWRVFQAFDHAAKGDRNVILTAAAPWPPFDHRKPVEAKAMYAHRIEVIELAMMKSSSSLTPAQQVAFAVRHYERHQPMVCIVDSTGEGGVMAYRGLRALGMRVRDMNFAGRLPGQHVTNKQYGTAALQKMLSFGLEVAGDDEALAIGQPNPGQPFGLFRIPHAGTNLMRLHRQLSTLRKDDEKQSQDEAMALVMLAWHLWPSYDRGPRASVSAFDIRAPRARRQMTSTRRYG